MKTILFCLLASVLFIGEGCARKTPTPTPTPTTYDDGFTINGGPFKNTTIYYKSVTASAGAYSVSNNITDVEIMGNNGDSLDLSSSITFQDKKLGAYSLGSSSDYVTITTTGHSSGNTMDFNSDNGSIQITRYDAVGGKIQGNFGGNFNSVGQAYTVTNGTFSVVRAPDVQ